ncbi:MAG TPA: T9SS type A sorting domain-containing protein [Cytophagaceae bacterium]|jgi:hypothetical protein
MKKKLVTTLIFALFLLCSFAQTISNVNVSNKTFCPGSKISVTFDTSGIFGVANTFKVQLSNERGEFSSVTNVDSTSIQNSIEIIIPDRPQSTQYKIRVVSSQPYTTSSNLGSLTLRANPVPAYNYQIAGRDVRPINTVLTGVEVIFKNTTAENGECEWYFGAGASVLTFVGCNPPPITYTTPGFKNPSLRIKNGGCSGETVYNGQVLDVVTCSPIIPSWVHVVRKAEDSDLNTDTILVCPGAVYSNKFDAFKVVYVEPGGTYLDTYMAYSTAIAKKGSVVSYRSPVGAVLYEESTSVTADLNIKILCPSVNFDYSLVKCGCNEKCDGIPDGDVITGGNEISDGMKFTLLPNPSQGNITINGVDENFSVAIYNAQGTTISAGAFKTNHLDLSYLKTGFYTVKVTDCNGVRMEKLIISK